jgi:hypothetical protein
VLRISRSTRKALADCSYFLGSVWGAAGALKLIFGVRITFPLFPPIDLERVSPWPAIAVALGLFALGAWLGRGTTLADQTRPALPSEQNPGEDALPPKLRQLRKTLVRDGSPSDWREEYREHLTNEYVREARKK